jgi:hypothetical protein
MADDIDVESQASQGSQGLPLVEVGVTLSEAKVAYWEKRFGQRPYCARPGKYHSHGVLAAQRFVAERLACEILLSDPEVTVIDVGAAPHRTSRWLGDRGWYVMPRLHPSDASRIASVPPAARDRVCHCRIEECVHVGATAALLCVHSAYYFDPGAFWLLLNDARVRDCIVVEHPFTDIAGGFCGEADWSFDGEFVTMQVKGQEQTPYRHRLPPWVTGWRGEGGEAFHAETLESWDGITRLVRVSTVIQPSPPRVLTWGEVQAEDNQAGPVQFSASTRAGAADNARLGHVTFDFDNVLKVGPFLYTTSVFRGETTRIVMPINGVARAAAFVANRERTPALYQELTHAVKTWYTRGRLPAHKTAQIISAIVALGFVANLQVEVDLLHTVVSRQTWRMEALTTLLGFGKLVVRRWYWLFFFLLGLVGVTTLVDIFDDNGEVDVWFTATIVLFILVGFFCVCQTLPMYQRFQRWREQAWVASISDEDSPRAPLLGNEFTFTRNLPIPGSRYVRPVPSHIQGSVSLGASREKELPKTGLLVSGIVMDGMVPTALDATQHAELSAVTNRILVPKENPKLEALSELKETFEAPDMHPPGTLNTGVEGLKKWLATIAKKYPRDYVKQMEDLWHKFQGTVPTPTPTKGFLKVEMSASPLGVEGGKAVKPRLIQPPSDESKAVLGPMISQLQQRYVKHWDGSTSPIMYCSGYTNSAVGKRVDDFIALCGGEGCVEAWSMDMESYDATLSLPLQVYAFGQYHRNGLPAWAVQWLLATRPRGQTPNGVIYSPSRNWTFRRDQKEACYAFVKLLDKLQFKRDPVVETEEGYDVVAEDFQMVSGRSDTNLTDSVVLSHAVSAVMRRHPEIAWLLLVCGDDGFLMLPKGHGQIFDEVKDFARDLGLKPTGTISDRRADWEFCSRLFFFGKNPKTGEIQTVLGAKPFRGIARMGVNTTLPGAQNAAAAAISVRMDAGHVPFLAPFADRTYELCRDSRVKPTGRPEWSAFAPESVRWLCPESNYQITLDRYNLGREAELEFIGRLSQLERVPCTMSWVPALDAVRVDEA